MPYGAVQKYNAIQGARYLVKAPRKASKIEDGDGLSSTELTLACGGNASLHIQVRDQIQWDAHAAS